MGSVTRAIADYAEKTGVGKGMGRAGAQPSILEMVTGKGKASPDKKERALSRADSKERYKLLFSSYDEEGEGDSLL